MLSLKVENPVTGGRCVCHQNEIEKSELPFGSRGVIVDKKRPQKNERAGGVLGRREAT